MDYRPPQTVSAPYEVQHLAAAPSYQFWNLGWTVEINKPEPPVNNHTGPKGRLKWINPVPLFWHNISPSGEDKLTRSKDWKLHQKGWCGISVSSMSRFEETRVMAYVDGLGDRVYKMRPYMWESDARPGDIGAFKERIRCFYFETNELRQGLVKTMEQIPVRKIEMYVDRKQFNPQCRNALRGLNWHIFEGEDADLFTVEEAVSSAALMTIRLLCGVAKPT